ncbi:Phosphatidylethanolamine N-methyltransferase [Minicystis rosea]|nr:Phosphatidylethanolamine N-methyltransferase [Minicystis rosea]
MGWYEQAIFNPFILDRFIDVPSIAAERRRALASASGEVLEIGLGTGLNLPSYPDTVRALVALGPEEAITPRAARRAVQRGLSMDHVSGDARSLPFATGRFDTVVATFVLCTIPEPARAVREMARVLRPGGRLLFLEHVADTGGARRMAQRIGNAPLRPLLCGCEVIRDSERAIADNGFTIIDIVRFEARTSPLMWLHRPMIRGVATPR